LCSVTRDNDQSAQPIIQDRDPPQLPGVFVVPHVNQVLGNATRIVATINDQIHAPFVSQQTQRIQEGVSYAPLQKAKGSLQVQTAGAGRDEAQAPEMIAEGLRRLARRYVNSPESLVNAVRLEPAPSGRMQVVIVIEIAEIL